MALSLNDAPDWNILAIPAFDIRPDGGLEVSIQIALDIVADKAIFIDFDFDFVRCSTPLGIETEFDLPSINHCHIGG